MWTTPTPPFFKINVDDTWMAHLHAKVSIIIRKAKSLVQASSEKTKAEAKLARMKLAHKHYIDHAIIESDSKVVIHTLSNFMCKGAWPIFPIVNTIPIPSPSLVMVLPRDGLPCLLLDEF
ncbi:pre-mRNA-processing ATP-dependent RNA helicase PRP5-like [Pyrus ussuriensis x Pyrus communis]|uniref:Pre-mRNA-processing ATP-dependent RNA helicase PRP5-like n=1 Tax=Pyrus ussuriensis x Pyrus communis TaxID=2448454 RepID=A0A5N5H6S5_9ROSA|nr:pre-mRNA-processing ATP-dependent RNA helicase PRP5-like [Pyrus ussuriensis x Pyrus communis]